MQALSVLAQAFVVPVAYFALIAALLALLFPAQRLIHIFQLESYKRPQLFLRLKEDGSARRPWKNWRRWRSEPSKKPLNYTARVKRLIAALALVLLAAAAVGVGVLALIWNAMAAQLVLQALVFALALCALYVLATLLLPQLLALASLLVQPVEKAIQRRYFNEARDKLAGFTGLIKIGITGSYGKTSAKMILATILSEKYKTLATPASYNTPMGVTRVIRESLDETYEVFIGEMGARHRGDIAEMCELVRPQYGLITSIGPQHLETMFNIETIAKTKYELVEALPADGMAFLPGDNDICFGLYKQTSKPKALFGMQQRGEALYMTARDIAHGPQGSTFRLVGPEGEEVQCTTKLLGEHNVQNILGCAAVARALGLTMEQIAAGIGKVQPVEHRLQLVPTNNGVTVIDDAFNSNPAGARAALAVLKSFPGRKIIVTPGLVELGDAEAQENRAFGQAMAAAVDVAILVARNAGDMKAGLLEAGFPEGSVHAVGRLAEATAVLGRIGRPGDVVLFENDLPDHYET